ncbi:MAG: aldo/keto reductase [Ruminococcus sp.]|nr:aldo/keto reductase [Ruminococcus sp.]
MFKYTLKNKRYALELPCLTYGTANFETQDNDEFYFSLLDRYVELGGTCIDTARVYCEWLENGKDASESVVGRWMKSRGNRAKIILSTKGGHPDVNDMSKSRLDRDSLNYDLERSLECLQTDYIDIYFLHRDDDQIPVSEIMPVLAEFVQSGKVRFIGASNWTTARIEQANKWAEQHNTEPFRVSQINYSLAHSSTDTFGDPTLVCMNMWEYNWYRKHQMPVMAFSPQAKGFFARFAKGDATVPVDGQFTSTANLARLARVKKISEETGVPPAVVPLGYLNSQQFFVSSVFAASKLWHLDEDMAAQDLRYDPKTAAFLENIL